MNLKSMNLKTTLLLLNILLVIILFNKMVLEKEDIIDTGKLIYLKMAPKDPRSLMQGDYMDLRYAITELNMPDSVPTRGYCVVTLDAKKIATKLRFQKHQEPRDQGEYLIKYNHNGKRFLNIGAESYFFEEGQASRFEKARYSGLKIDDDGNSLLHGLYDSTLKFIDPKQKD